MVSIISTIEVFLCENVLGILNIIGKTITTTKNLFTNPFSMYHF